jgi:hypothetical protein
MAQMSAQPAERGPGQDRSLPALDGRTVQSVLDQAKNTGDHVVVLLEDPRTKEKIVAVAKVDYVAPYSNGNFTIHFTQPFLGKPADQRKPGDPKESGSFVKQTVSEHFAGDPGCQDFVAKATAHKMPTQERIVITPGDPNTLFNYQRKKYAVRAIEPIKLFEKPETPALPAANLALSGPQKITVGATEFKKEYRDDPKGFEISYGPPGEAKFKLSIWPSADGRFDMTAASVDHPEKSRTVYAERNPKNVIDVVLDAQPSHVYDKTKNDNVTALGFTVLSRPYPNGPVRAEKGYLKLDGNGVVIGGAFASEKFSASGSFDKHTYQIPDLREHVKHQVTASVVENPNRAQHVTPAVEAAVVPYEQELAARAAQYKPGAAKDEQQLAALQVKKALYLKGTDDLAAAVFARSKSSGYQFDEKSGISPSGSALHALFTGNGVSADWYLAQNYKDPANVPWKPSSLALHSPEVQKAVGSTPADVAEADWNYACPARRITSGDQSAYVFPSSFIQNTKEQKGILFMDDKDLPPIVSAAYRAAAEKGSGGEMLTGEWMMVQEKGSKPEPIPEVKALLRKNGELIFRIDGKDSLFFPQEAFRIVRNEQLKQAQPGAAAKVTLATVYAAGKYQLQPARYIDGTYVPEK